MLSPCRFHPSVTRATMIHANKTASWCVGNLAIRPRSTGRSILIAARLMRFCRQSAAPAMSETDNHSMKWYSLGSYEGYPLGGNRVLSVLKYRSNPAPATKFPVKVGCRINASDEPTLRDHFAPY